MNTAIEMRDYFVAKAEDNSAFRARLLENPKAAIKQEFGVVLPQGHAVEVHEETDNVAHLVLPAKSRFSDADRKAAMTGDTSLEYLRKVLHRPAPPARPPVEKPASAATRNRIATLEALAEAGRVAIRRGLEFLETAVDKDGSWHAIRYMLYKPDGPRHFETTPFTSALGALALERCGAARARAICARPAFAQLRPVLADRIMGYRGAGGDFGDILLTAQAVSALDMIGSLKSGQTQHHIARFVDTQREDGSWPEQLAWDVPLMGFASEALATAFCIEALERCIRPERPDQ